MDNKNVVCLKRLEWPCSLGIYGVRDGDEQSVAYEIFGGDAPNHKAPHKDKKLSKAMRYADANLSDYFYAFASTPQLLRWLYKDEWLFALHERGVVVSEYVCKVDSVLHGSHQSVFKSSESRESFSILSYFEI